MNPALRVFFQEQEQHYDLLLEEEQIAFVMADKMPGSRKKSEEEIALSEKEKKKLSIEETRKSLPIYLYRDALLEAIEEHQVLIIEGLISYSSFARCSSLQKSFCFILQL